MTIRIFVMIRSANGDEPVRARCDGSRQGNQTDPSCQVSSEPHAARPPLPQD